MNRLSQSSIPCCSGKKYAITTGKSMQLFVYLGVRSAVVSYNGPMV